MNMQIHAVNEDGEFLVFDGTEKEWAALALTLDPAVIFQQAETVTTAVPMLNRHLQSILALKDEGITAFGVEYNTGKPNSDYRQARVSFEFEMQNHEILLSEEDTALLDQYLQYEKPEFIHVIGFDLKTWEYEYARYYARLLNNHTLSLINTFTGELLNDLEVSIL